MRRIIPFNDNWRFCRDEEIDTPCRDHGLPDVPNPEPRQWQKAGWHSISKSENPHVKEWRVVNLPHDFLIEGKFSAKAPQKTGSLPYGSAWYAKDFKVARKELGKRIFVEFDGIYRNAQVYLNGHFIGRRMSGYVSQNYDITEVCNYGGTNTIAVFADATETEQWSYQGGGIYRAVRLVITDPVYVKYCGLDIKTKNNGAIDLDVDVANESYKGLSVTVEAQVINTDAKGTGRVSVGQLDKNTASLKLKVSRPKLWSLEEPNLYRLKVNLKVRGNLVDSYEQNFGFRSIKFSAKNGFLLNGRNIKIKGTCCHQDFAGVGVAVPPELQEWRVLRLKSMGCNAIRTSHNMPDPALLDACDKHGMMVMEETRLPGCAEELLRDVSDTVLRDRNHPCVIIWSLANEEPIMTTSLGARIFKKMNELVHRLDSTRPTTCAVVGDWFKAAGLFEKHGFRLDLFGMNYGHHGGGERFDKFHRKHSDWPFISTESWGGFTSRGLYEHNQVEMDAADYWANNRHAWESEKYRGFVSAYGTTFAGYGCHIEECWQQCANRPSLAGTFIWTGFDYRGETAPHTWPAVISYFGMLDLCGFYKEIAHYLKCWWKPEEPHTFLMPHWNWQGRKGKKIRVRCYSNAEEVELRLNDRKISRKRMPENDKLEWQVRFEPGKIEAIGYDKNGKETSRTERTTVLAPAQLALSKEVIGNVAVISAAVQDKKGNLHPLADNLIKFDVSGDAEILGVGNGNPISHEPAKFTNKRKAHFGLCQIIVRKKKNRAKISVTAKSARLKSGTICF